MAKANSNGKRTSVLVPAVAYVRMSTDHQDESPAQQRAAITKLAERDGYQIIRWYQDDGIAGWKSDEREAFRLLIGDAEKRHDFRAVLCWDQNRFSRFPPMEANHYWFLLDREGIHLATVNQGRIDWHSIAGWLTASIRQHADSEHRHKLSADVKRGKRARAERGEWQGKIPFAYVVENKRLVLGDPEAVEVMRRIVREYIEGRSLRSIAHRLNAEGLDALNGGRKWVGHSIRSKLNNHVYAGIFRWRDIEIQGNHPAVIDVDTFETIQRLLTERKPMTTPKKDGGGYLFTGILRCGKCESAMHGFTNGPREYYWCQGHKQKGSTFCDLNSIKQHELLDRVVGAIEGHFMNPKVVKRLREELHRQVSQDNPKVDPTRIAKQLKALDEKLTKAKRRLIECDSDMLPVVQEHIRELRSEHERLEVAQKNAQTPRERIFGEADQRIDRAMQMFSTMRQTILKADPVHQREFLREAVQRIDVWAERNGKRDNYRLDHGVIVLRSDNLFNSPD